jgi:hypothetical protein
VKLVLSRNIITKLQHQQKKNVDVAFFARENFLSSFYLTTKKKTTTVEIKSNSKSFKTSKRSKEKENK